MNLKIEENVSLAELTTLRIGGAAKFFMSAQSENQVIEALAFAEKNNLQTFILGGGSNVLIADAGFDGLVLQIALKGVSIDETEDEVFVTANAGEDWDDFCRFCVDENLAGIECLSGIPGFVGGTPVQNVGAYGQEVSEAISSVRVFDRIEKRIAELRSSDCGFAYRTSVFNTAQKNRYVVTAVTFALKRNGNPKIVYKDLREFFNGKESTLQETRKAVLKIRALKSMLIDASDPNSKSAGSFFKNPIIVKEKFAEIQKRAANLNVGSVPFFTFDEENVKVPAAWLIENSGFCKGFRKHNAGISSNHSLAIINLGNASAKDVLQLKNEIQAKVKELFDVELQPEPIFVGF